MPLAWSRNLISHGMWPKRPPNGGLHQINPVQGCLRPSSLMVKQHLAGTQHLSRPGLATSRSNTRSIAPAPQYDLGVFQSFDLPIIASCSAMRASIALGEALDGDLDAIAGTNVRLVLAEVETDVANRQPPTECLVIELGVLRC